MKKKSEVKLKFTFIRDHSIDRDAALKHLTQIIVNETLKRIGAVGYTIDDINNVGG